MSHYLEIVWSDCCKFGKRSIRRFLYDDGTVSYWELQCTGHPFGKVEYCPQCGAKMANNVLEDLAEAG